MGNLENILNSKLLSIYPDDILNKTPMYYSDNIGYVIKDDVCKMNKEDFFFNRELVLHEDFQESHQIYTKEDIDKMNNMIDEINHIIIKKMIEQSFSRIFKSSTKDLIIGKLNLTFMVKEISKNVVIPNKTQLSIIMHPSFLEEIYNVELVRSFKDLYGKNGLGYDINISLNELAVLEEKPTVIMFFNCPEYITLRKKLGNLITVSKDKSNVFKVTFNTFLNVYNDMKIIVY